VNANLAAFEVDVLDTEPRAFEESKARAVQQAGHQQGYAAELGEQAGYLARREHDRYAFRALRAHERNLLFEADGQDVVVEKD
jgi:hypothetical protein